MQPTKMRMYCTACRRRRRGVLEEAESEDEGVFFNAYRDCLVGE
jgi:hypothetical protein